MADKKHALTLALEDPALPQVLKEIQQVVVPNKDIGAFRALVASGAVDPLFIPEQHPLMSPVSLAMSGEDPKKWLAALFSQNNDAFLAANVALSSYYGQPQIAYFDMDRYKVEIQPLLPRLVQNGDYAFSDFLTIAPAAAAKLAEMPLVKRGGDAPEPLFHHTFNTSDCSVAMLDRLEQLTGSDDFLMLRNARGETMFHRIAAHPGFQHDEAKTDMLSWMLQRRPQLVNDTDRFGWTPLDRLVSRVNSSVDTPMGRLLIVAGARMERQIAPGFNLAAALEEHGHKRLDKAAVRKLPGAAAPSA